MANAAGGIGLYAQLAVPLHPGQIMAGRFNIPIHINVAGLAILSGGMGFIADLHNVIALQFWHRGKILIKYGSVAFLTLVRHRLCVDKDIPLLPGFRLPLVELRQELFLMAVPTGVHAHLVRFRFVVAVDAGFMRDGIERCFAKIAMALAAIHFIFRHMEIVAELQLIFFLVASGKQQYRTGK